MYTVVVLIDISNYELLVSCSYYTITTLFKTY